MPEAEKDENKPAREVFPVEKSLPLFRAFDTAASAEAARPDPVTFEDSRKRLAALIDHLPQRAAIEDANAAKWLERTMRTAVMRMELEAESSDYSEEEKARVREIMEDLGSEDAVKTLDQRKALEDELARISEASRSKGDKGEERDPAAMIKMVGDAHRHVLWHIRRASGIGGSEAGTVMKHFRGKKGTFGDAHNLVLEKLLILSPRPSTEEMARGVRAEPWVQKMYHEKHGVVSAEAELAKLKGFRWDKRPASVGTPDDIVIHHLGEFAGKMRCLDYKAPSAKVVEDYEANGVSEDYVAQVHHYGTLQIASGSKFDVMSIEAFDPRTFKIVSFPVTFDKNLAVEIANSCHRIWHEFVMNGVVPDAPKPDDLPVNDEGLIEIGAQAAMLKKLADEIGKRQKELQERISLIGTDWHGQATGKMDLKVASFTRKRKWDEEALTDLAAAADIDTDPFMIADKKGKLDADLAATYLKDILEAAENGTLGEVLAAVQAKGMPVEHKLDLDALAQHLEEAGIDVLPAMGVSESFLMSRKTKGEEFERMTQLSAWVTELVDGISGMAETEAPRIILGREPDVEEDGFDPEPA